MNRVCAFLFLGIFLAVLSCSNPKNSKFLTSDFPKKEIDILYNKGLNDSLSLSERKNYINRALALSKQDDSIKALILYSKCNLHFLEKQYDSLLHFGEHLKSNTTKTENYFTQGRYYHLLAYYHSKITSNLDSSFYYHNQAKNSFTKVNDSIQIGRRLLSMGILQHNQNDFFGSKETLIEALRYFEKSGNKRFLASVYNELATNHRKLINFEDAIFYYRKAITVADGIKSVSIFKNNLATTFIDNKNYENAITLLSGISNTNKLESIEYARVLDNLAYARWRNNENVPIHHFIKPLHIRKKENDKRGQIASYTHLGEYYSRKSPQKAEMYFDSVIQLSKELKIPRAEQDALKFLMDLQPKNVKIRNRYVLLQDSLYQVGLKVKTQFAKMKYDDEQKQHSILKLENERERRNTELAEQRTQKTIWLSLSGLLVIGGISAFYSLRQRHKKEKLQEVYETEKRISKKVHDELANDIYGVMTRMEHSETFQKENTLDNLEDIYNRTRDISHETGSIDTQNFQDELKKLLSQFRNDETTIAVKGLSIIKWDGISDERKITVYRILNELLVNMKKHSGATLASINFEKPRSQLKIAYKDNGRGLQLPLEKGVGLSNTENRIKNLGGTFSFESEPGKGVKINFTFPI